MRGFYVQSKAARIKKNHGDMIEALAIGLLFSSLFLWGMIR